MAFPTWLLGVMLAVGASVISNLGLNLQKRAHMNLEKHTKPHKRRASVLKHQLLNGAPKEDGGDLDSSIGHVPSVTFSDHADKQTNPLSSTSILKKTSNGIGSSTHGHYHRITDGDDGATGTVTERERRAQRRATTILPAAPGSVDRQSSAPAHVNGTTGSGQSSSAEQSPASSAGSSTGSNSYLTESQGSVALDSLGATATRKQNVSSRAPSSGRHRSHSTAVQPSREHRHGTRRRSSVMTHPPANKGHYTRQPIWILGLVCVILGSLLDFAALAFVDQSVVAPLGSLTLVSNVFFAPLLLGEKVHRKQVYCTALIIAGSVLAVAFAPHADSSPNDSTQQMFDNFAQLQFILYAVLVAGSVVALRVACWKFHQVRHADPNGAYLKVSRYHTFAYAACAGIMGAQSVLFAKCTAMLLAESIAGHGLMFVYWETYFVLLGLGVTIFLQIRWLNSGLRMFSALMIVPIFQSFWILVSVIGGLIFFDEASAVFSKASSAVIFPLGLILTITGVYFLTQINTGSDAEHVVPAPGTPHRKRSRSHIRAGSMSAAGAGYHATMPTPDRLSTGLRHITVPIDDLTATASASEGLTPMVNGVATTPLMRTASAEHYGVPQSPRVPHTATNLAGRKKRPPPISPQTAASTPSATFTAETTSGAAATAAEIDRSVDLGSYSAEEKNEQHLTVDDTTSLEPSPSSLLDQALSSDLESDDDDDTIPDYDAQQYALAPINFPMYLFPRVLDKLMAEPETPRPYFEQNASGFQEGDAGVDANGLPYEKIFRIGEAGEWDEENPATPSAQSREDTPDSPSQQRREVEVTASVAADRRATRSAPPVANFDEHASLASTATDASHAFSPAMLGSPAMFGPSGVSSIASLAVANQLDLSSMSSADFASAYQGGEHAQEQSHQPTRLEPLSHSPPSPSASRSPRHHKKQILEGAEQLSESLL